MTLSFGDYEIDVERRELRRAKAKDKRTAESEADTNEMAAQIEKSLGDAFEGNALAYLMSVYSPDGCRSR